MLKHPHADDLVVGPGRVQVAVVAILNPRPLGHPRPRDPLPRVVHLRLAQVDPGGVDSVVLRGVDHQPAPPAADVQQALAGLQAQLAADVLELGRLRRVQVVGLAPEVGAGVGHRLPQEQGVEVVTDIVVVGDGGPVAAAGMARALQAGRLPPVAVFLRRERGRQAEGQAGQGQPLARGEALHPHRQPQRGDHIALQLVVAAQVGFGQRQLARRQEHPPQRAGMGQDDREPRLPPWRRGQHAAIPQAHGKVALLLRRHYLEGAAHRRPRLPGAGLSVRLRAIRTGSHNRFPPSPPRLRSWSGDHGQAAGGRGPA